jgi:hypothetical protein
LAEETGLRAEELVHLGHLFEAYGYADQGFDVYLATGLVEGEPDREITEHDTVHRFVTDAELTHMMWAGDVIDATSIAAWALYRLHAM